MKEENKKKKKMGLRGRIRLIYAVVLVLYVIFVLLDAFVIPRDIVNMGTLLGMNSGTDHARYEPVIKERSYTDGDYVLIEKSYDDGNIFIDIETDRWLDTTVYIADVRIKDPTLLKVGLAEDSFGRNLVEVTSEIAERNGAVFAINGDYYGFRETGYVLRNGFLYRSESNTVYPYGEDLVIWNNGAFEIKEESDFTAEELHEKGAQHIFSFGPALVRQGKVNVMQGEEVERAQITNPRTAIGIVDSLHYIMVVSDGRTAESVGLSLYQLGYLMQNLGCKTAYNLDGGGSSTMWFNGEVLNKPTTFGDVIEERPISDILYIGY